MDNWNLASSLEFAPSVKLFELWYEQPILDGKVSIRIGQMAADQEFIVSKYAPLFLNSAFGWPTLPGVVLPEGGPAYPLGTPGIRLKVQPTDSLALLAAVFNGNPNDNGSGTSFTLDKGVFAIAEAQYSINGGDNAPGLPGTYHLGAWYNSNEFDFDDERRGGPPFELPAPYDNDMLTAEHKRRLQHLWHGRSDALSRRRHEGPRSRRLHAHHGRAGRPQCDQLLSRCGLEL